MPVRELISRLINEVRPQAGTTLPENEDALKCDICGIPLENPFLLSSSVVASGYDMCARAFEAGWAGACYKTVCSMDILETSPRFSAVTSDNGTLAGFKNIEQLSVNTVEEDMDVIKRLKSDYPSKFIEFNAEKCIGCGRCFISCSDGGHQAIRFEGRRPKLNGKNCVGCHLCLLVCPADAISPCRLRKKTF